MAVALLHRGPDDMGVWTDDHCGLALAHRRLSILDLSPAGHQPMCSSTGRMVIVFNGEIYNHSDLRKMIEAAGMAPPWRGYSDTEVLLEAIEIWGIEEAIKRTVGMFALAVWDTQKRVLHLARDRMGEKPLYYGLCRGALVFGSELKAIVAFPGFERRVDRTALGLYLWHNFIPAPYAIYEGIKKLPPGSIVSLGEDDLHRATLPPPSIYWSLREKTLEARANPLHVSDAEALSQLDGHLTEAIRLQCLADVPVGAFLSGGIDSSLIVALMQRQSSRPVRTFSIGFRECDFDESVAAQAIAQHLGAEHHAITLTPRKALDVIPNLPWMYDEPFADSSQIPAHLVAAAAACDVTVSLSGDAADELFGGYNRYVFAPRLWSMGQRAPAAFRSLATGCVRGILNLDDVWLNRFARLAGGGLLASQPRDRLQKIGLILGAANGSDLHAGLAACWPHPQQVVLGLTGIPDVYEEVVAGIEFTGLAERMMFIDSVIGLSDDILVKVDRAAMAASLETRVPFLDHRVVEWALRVPASMHIRDKRGKWLLRQLLARHVPESLTDRPKMGFGIPLGDWLRGELKEWAEGLLEEKKLQQQGFFDPAPIRKKWEQHLAGKHNFQIPLWSILMFQAWLEKNGL